MGREKARLRERTIRQLEQRLHRKPTDDEVERAIADLQESQRKATGRAPAERPKRLGKR